MTAHSPSLAAMREGQPRSCADEQHAANTFQPYRVPRVLRQSLSVMTDRHVKAEDRQLDRNRAQSENRQLSADGALRIDELRQDGGKENQRLRIGALRDQPGRERAETGSAATRIRIGEPLEGTLLRRDHHPDATPNQVSGPEPLDDREELP